MAKVADSLVWTDAGRAELAEEKAYGTTPMPAPRDDVAKAAAAVVKQYAPKWKKGAAMKTTDAVGKAAAKYAAAWKPGAKGTPEQLAGLVSLAAANGDDVEGPVIECVIRDHGMDVTMQVLVATWGQYATYDTKGTARVAALAAEDAHAFDTSACSGKGEMTRYLQRRHHASGAKERAAMKRAADAVWKGASRPAKVALAVATNDPKRAAEIANELFANPEPYPHFAWNELPHVLADPELVMKIFDAYGRRLSYRMLETLGATAIPLLEAKIAERIDKHSRARALAMAANIKSPTIARILAEYAEQEPYTQTVRAYFTMHPDLHAEMLADPELRYYHDDLRAISAR